MALDPLQQTLDDVVVLELLASMGTVPLLSLLRTGKDMGGIHRKTDYFSREVTFFAGFWLLVASEECDSA